jgi:hypothetical protein
MAATISLQDPQITINNEVIQIVPNSGVLKLGLGEDTAEVVSAGNSNTDIVVGTNVETTKAMVSFGMKNTNDNIDRVTRFKALRGDLTVSVAEGSFNKIVRKATIINDPEFTFSNDSNITVEIEGLTAK